MPHSVLLTSLAWFMPLYAPDATTGWSRSAVAAGTASLSATGYGNGALQISATNFVPR